MRKLLLTVVLLVALIGGAAGQTAQASKNHGIGTAVTYTIRHNKPHAPAWFVRQAACVHHYEAGAWKWTPYFHPGYSYWNHYWTGLQFVRGTWATANRLLGVHVNPQTGNPRVVIRHAYAIVRHDGSWREWKGTASLCGLPVG